MADWGIKLFRAGLAEDAWDSPQELKRFLMGYTFARVSAAVGMKVGDFYVQNRRGWVRAA